MITPMGNPVIAPLAQRLAEENNVDWRTLRGSGDGGSVVESDVLTYLARVMSGEEAIYPTPEPAPESLSAWAEEPPRHREVAPDPLSSPFTLPTAAPPATSAPADEGFASPWTLDLDTPGTPAQMGTDAPATAQVFTVDGVAPSQGEVAAALDAPPAAGVPEAVHSAVVAELAALKTRLAELEEERSGHVDELRQLSRMQETHALESDENAHALQAEVQSLKEALTTSRSEAQRVGELEARLERARAFRADAKTEFERLSALNAALEAELAALKKRPWWLVRS
ncbi:MAG: hypothetical protein AVDCRST_MAG86-2520 [uncultured Truepera sp.]|uniref:Peripheral subunit-binding (PSBD) domain-containing protein n=1 Tax=uncultured Truepera sp. TaxID=543023 RepID=A0A6J4VGU5_9DEIN|nr:MAG: hypothetical protein AVDCRST_MAG86-2520 [uncultured Truepera sp.]